MWNSFDDEYTYSDNSEETDSESENNFDDNFFPEKSVLKPKRDDFDSKIAKSIVNIHRNVYDKTHFSNWVDDNYVHLYNMYEFTDRKIQFQDFCTFIYDNSDHKN